MDIEKYNYTGNESIGFHATVTETQAIFPPDFKRKDKFNAEKTVETYINRTKLVGLFTAGNSNCILIPEEATDREKDKLEETGIEFQVIETPDNALGNLILCNDNGAYISPKLEDQKEEIEEALEVPVTVGTIAGIQNPGVCGLANSRGAVIHREADEDDAEKVKEALELEDIDIGTINLGSPYMGSGGLATDDMTLVGENTSGPEIGRIDRTMK
ncbi:translation initiation factor IF-6 [Candidatus Nanohalobium constans]|uniref:Translation initiation factor 6 n=1 Tax=Candidatus Nanohalobium constans TaxID=2565781 RepID=A0A5Q0UF01_9ARCH|nr:translation initiation factor IF-6 [Candidatus Nanohalobium constans]QGA80137.1 translation initiation factor 6 [Candidatus Nanohalobium constans]